MANWCSNTVEFRGEPGQLEKLKELLTALYERERSEDKAQLPEFVKVKEGYFFELELGMFPTVVYETRWVHNTDVVKQVADHFGLAFVHEYAEPMNGLSGEAHYFGGVLFVMD